MSATLKVQKEGSVATITISNPPANTWTEATLGQLKSIIAELNKDKENYALIITGEGEKFFSAGADLNLFASGEVAVANKMSRAFGAAFEALADYDGVSIAAINGFAMGGGLECALACDLRIAEEQALMALPEAKVGLLPCGCGTQNLPWLVGEGWAKRMILCGEQLKAPKALEIGLVEEVVEKGKALEAATKLAQQVGNQSPSAVRACKSLIMAARSNPMKSSLSLEREMFCDLFDTEDQKEGVNAFLEKRKPEWKNA